ncbi:uncharacterized protein SPAPADRAFT_48116 [Spathaspora passalidarum NRRL Y-27907]|uniref:Uncharacterized protein n=1 Tax=Spathaspora passalidarum (strain NRRL Y-27907 / 11-Y1) TaxID=619300 RepID=G3AFS8_SPAPN|nr:uncharacterized protein SPAPADRAFT_48116 [Spathaspora passalidarum NRRL Y-27907]EGW35067.1 hypothetical protein SPAPADRAFT_48116 [Spathaspora passalidarum NRRL Y-27907]
MEKPGISAADLSKFADAYCSDLEFLDDDLEHEEMNLDEIRNHILRKAKKRVIKINKTEDNKYKRFFIDGSTDIVSRKDVRKPALRNPEDVYAQIDKLEKHFASLDPITKLRFGVVETCERREIETPAERIFFGVYDKNESEDWWSDEEN